MVDPVAVISYPIHCRHVTLVLNGASQQQGFPVGASSFRPVGHNESQLIIKLFCSPRPYRETQVITNHWQDLPSFITYDHAAVPGSIVLLLVTHAEQVALIISDIISV